MSTTASQAIFDSLNEEADISNLFAEFEIETLHLDFKQVPQDPLAGGWDNVRTLISKAMGGFSNADGGVLVLGVSENRDRNAAANQFTLSPIAESERLAARIQENVSRVTDPPNHLIEVKRIPGTAEGTGYVVVHIPKSDTGPHQDVRDRKYYQRSGESHQAMAHFQIADLFGRRPQPDLKAVLTFKRDVNNRQSVAVELRVKNSGRGIAKYAFVTVDSTGQFRKRDHYTSWFAPGLHYRRPNVFIATSDHVIHSGIDVPAYEYFLSFPSIEGATQEAHRTFSGTIGSEGMQTRPFQIEIPWPELIRYRDQEGYLIPDLIG